jgi:hypothetical protein
MLFLTLLRAWFRCPMRDSVMSSRSVRPTLELLEDRLPPGDMLGGAGFSSIGLLAGTASDFVASSSPSSASNDPLGVPDWTHFNLTGKTVVPTSSARRAASAPSPSPTPDSSTNGGSPTPDFGSNGPDSSNGGGSAPAGQSAPISSSNSIDNATALSTAFGSASTASADSGATPSKGPGGDGGGDSGGLGARPSSPRSAGSHASPILPAFPRHRAPSTAASGYVGSQVLKDLVTGYSAAKANNSADQFIAAEQRELVFDDAQRVLVNVRLRPDAQGADPLGQLRHDLETNLGLVGTQATPGQQIVTGYLPIQSILTLPSATNFGAVTPVYAPELSTGVVTSQGVSVIGADTFSARTGDIGTGVTVGVLSDSVNQINSGVDAVGDKGIAQSQRKGALPVSGVQVFQDGTAKSTDEGRGILEIVHDVAPGASLAFNTAEGGPQAFAKGIQTLATQGHANVILDNVQYPNEPFFNDGLLAQTVDQVSIDQNVNYVTAAGNNADHAYEGAFRSTTAAVAGQTGQFQNFSVDSSKQQVLQHFTLAVGQTIDLSLQWDSAFLESGSNLAQYQVQNEVDALLTDGSGQQLIHRFGDDTRNTGEALQRVVFTNDGTHGTNDFALAFQSVAGPAPTRLKWIRFDNNAPAEFQGAPTIFGHAAAGNALTVGAVPFDKVQTPESFTSQGLATIYFDANGNRLSHPVQRFKPELAGPDGVHTADFPAQTTPLPKGEFPVFTGTSAAAAHTAGVVALQRALAPTESYWGVAQTVEHNATAIGPVGWNRFTGFGLDPVKSPATPPAPTIPLTNASWSLIGPAPVTGVANVGGNPVDSGRVAGIAADPTNASILYLATAGGGAWKSINAGASWTPTTDNQSTLFMGAVAVAPSNANVIYAGTGESTNSISSFYGRGVLKSIDGGATYTLLTNNGAFDRTTISKIAVSPTDPNTVYVAISGAGVNGNGAAVTGVYKSTDGGTTWTNTTTAIPSVTAATSFSDVVIDPANASNVFIAIGDAGGSAANNVYKSTDAGGTYAAAGNFKTLANANGLGVIKISISKNNPTDLFAVASDPVTQGMDFVAKTTDGGTTWTNVSPGVNYVGGQGFYDNVVAVDPTNAQVAYVAGSFNGTDGAGNFVNQILETTNGGTSWTDITVGADGGGVHPDHHALTFDANGKLLDGNDGGIWRLDTSTIGAIHWTDLNSNLSTLQFIGIGLHPTNMDIAYGGTQDNGTSKFTGALPWAQIQGGDGGFARVDQANPNTVYMEFFRQQGSTTFIQRSDDAGVTFTDISPGINSNDQSDFFVPYQLDQTNTARLVLGTDHLYESLDKGATYTIIGTRNVGGFTINATIDAIGLAKTDRNTIYVGDDQGNIFVTTNDGAAWTMRNIPGVSDHIQSLVVDPTNSMIVYATRDRFGTGKVFRSANGGTTWTDISGNLPDLPTYTLALDATNNILYVGNDNGVFSSADGGATWAQFGTGLPNVEVRELIFNPTLSILAAGSHGRSVWEISTVPVTPPPPPPPPPPPIPVGAIVINGENELNQTSDTAENLGVLNVGTPITFINQDITRLADGRNDYDWFRFAAGQAGTFTSTETTVTGGNLELHLFTLLGNTLVEIANSVAPGVSGQTLATAVAAGQPILVEVKGLNSRFGVQDQGMYQLDVSLT